MNRDPTLDEIIKAIQIYSNLSEKEIRQNMNRIRKKSHYTSLILAGLDYGTIEVGIPLNLFPDVVKLGHRLSKEEIEELKLRDRGYIKLDKVI